ncbi:MAG TPA: SDR family NAD(P)-dependent oxidoreductase, partial [Pseudonocardiaceae bacterium]|nr:SDR family NAD(P)-dependent oxidoreductase [Pseudonocardiaceae bacterium]
MSAALEGRRVLVTGGSSGIGAATARAAAAAGAQVAVLGRDSARVTAVATEIGGVAVTADITDLDAVPAALEETVRGLGGLDSVVHGAGVMVAGSVADTDPARWREMFDVNVVGLLAVTRAAIPHLLAASTGAPARAPSLVLMSSMSGRRIARPESGVYSAGKAAVHMVAETLRLELQPQGVRVSTIAPGFVRTPLADRLPEGELREYYRARLAEVGLDPEAVADAVVHILAQPAGVTVVEYALVPTA